MFIVQRINENSNNHYDRALPVYNEIELLHFQLSLMSTYFIFNFLWIILLQFGVTLGIKIRISWEEFLADITTCQSVYVVVMVKTLQQVLLAYSTSLESSSQIFESPGRNGLSLYDQSIPDNGPLT
ncbi:hypothetical protein HZH68_004964 [Vespula germanica]|uniref:Uncharacterized protein n=1 Tax=Vespula germanica TaxID=30212 RepID=A0A834KFD2_VESGE|nr:hypothetical protein HZH68_004964 [Vespula germanica]